MNTLLKIIAIGFLMSQFIGCASSKLVDMWHDPTFNTEPLGNVLVVAVRKDAAKRRIWEDAFTNDLVKHSVTATSSYHLFPDALPDTDQLISASRANGFDGVMVIRILPTETKRQFVQGYTTVAENVRYSSYWQRYRSYYTEIDHPGYIDSQKVAVHTIEVLTTGNGGHLIWSATSKTPNPRFETNVQNTIADLVLPDLKQKNVIHAKK